MRVSQPGSCWLEVHASQYIPVPRVIAQGIKHRFYFEQRHFAVRKPKRFVLAWCPECARQVQMVTPEEAASMAQVSTRTIYRRVEAGRVHFIETPENSVFVCRNSLPHLKT